MTRDEVLHVARLARIELSEEEVATLGGQLETILHYVRQLESYDVSSVPPAAGVLPLSNVTRPDLPVPSLTPAEALSGAPDEARSCFAVPRILEEA